MEPLPAFVPGSDDLRAFSVRGCGFYVSRGASSASYGFHAGGRDGDVVSPDAREPGILAELLAGIPGLRCVWGGDHQADDAHALDEVERRFRAASSPPYVSIARTVRGDRAVAERLIALPVPTAARRSVYVAKGVSLHVTVANDGSALAELGAWGRDPGDFFAAFEAATRHALERVGEEGRFQRRRVPAAALAQLLGDALERIGVDDVRVVDAFERG